MSMIDLWEGEGIPNQDPVAPQKVPSKHDSYESFSLESLPELSHSIHLSIIEDRIVLQTRKDLAKLLRDDFYNLYISESLTDGGIYTHILPLGALNAFVLRHILRRFSTAVAAGDGKKLAFYADKIKAPEARVAESGKHIEVTTPRIKTYSDILKKVGAYKTSEGYKVSIARAIDLEHLITKSNSILPKINVSSEVLALSRNPIPNFDGTLESLKHISPNVLNNVSANVQSYKSLKSSKATMEEKLHKFGITSLYDLLFTLPKKFIDKSNPQELEDLIEGEAVAVVGTISSTASLPNNMGIVFRIKNSRGKIVEANFWRQNWLKVKFAEGDEILITGRASWYRGKIQVGGSSIEHADEAAVLPIVPVYKQSETNGITTNFLMASMREFLSRAGEIELPPYLKASGRMNYTEALTELHFPSSLPAFKQACDDLAYYELVYMQIILQEERSHKVKVRGLAHHEGPRQLQHKAIESLPFKMTISQVKAVGLGFRLVLE